MIRPVQQPHPPIWIGGNGRRAIRRAVELGQAWLPSVVEPDALARGIDELHRVAAERERADVPAVARLDARPDPPRRPGGAGAAAPAARAPRKPSTSCSATPTSA